MEGSITAGARRIANILAFLAIVIIFVSGLITAGVSQITSAIGAVLALVAWGIAIVTALRASQRDWVVTLGIGFFLGAVVGVYGVISQVETTPVTHIVAQLGAMTIAFIASAYAVTGSHGTLERGVAAYFGTWALFTLVIGGTLVGGAIGTNIGAAAPFVIAVGFNLYAVAGVLGAFAWIIGIIVALRVGAHGWTTLVLLLPGIGAFMFGLFGPSREDVVRAQEHLRERKAVGLQ